MEGLQEGTSRPFLQGCNFAFLQFELLYCAIGFAILHAVPCPRLIAAPQRTPTHARRKRTAMRKSSSSCSSASIITLRAGTNSRSTSGHAYPDRGRPSAARSHPSLGGGRRRGDRRAGRWSVGLRRVVASP